MTATRAHRFGNTMAGPSSSFWKASSARLVGDSMRVRPWNPPSCPRPLLDDYAGERLCHPMTTSAGHSLASDAVHQQWCLAPAALPVRPPTVLRMLRQGPRALAIPTQVQAAAIQKPEINDDAVEKFIAEKVTQALVSDRKDAAEAVKVLNAILNTFGDDDSEHMILPSIIRVIIGSGQVQAAAIEKPEISVDAIEKFVGEKVTRALLSENRDVVEAVKVLKATLKTFGDDDSEHFFPLIIAAVTGIIRVINWTR
ncbi:hypothetical protein HPB51_026022 [Rhipicephalus microplus]|uniref:Uncharacterized protein n=1 Tax=Rhipicephalus microplus TaxID=6941 RepID=A0A9J6EDZ6_RHIMP|nr:hypothetical protein HPB51_026022 [Rhipicephalus microplus]